MGEYESFNFSICLQSEDIALFHALYRTSLKGRKDVVKLMFNDDDDDNAIDNTIDSSYTSVVSQVFGVYLKCLGIEVEFIDEDETLKPYDNEIIQAHELDGHCYMCTNYQFFLIERMNAIKKDVLAEYPIITNGELKEKIEKEMRKRKYITGSIEDEVGMIELASSLLVSDEEANRIKSTNLSYDLDSMDFSDEDDEDDTDTETVDML